MTSKEEEKRRRGYVANGLATQTLHSSTPASNRSHLRDRFLREGAVDEARADAEDGKVRRAREWREALDGFEQRDASRRPRVRDARRRLSRGRRRAWRAQQQRCLRRALVDAGHWSVLGRGGGSSRSAAGARVDVKGGSEAPRRAVHERPAVDDEQLRRGARGRSAAGRPFAGEDEQRAVLRHVRVELLREALVAKDDLRDDLGGRDARDAIDARGGAPAGRRSGLEASDGRVAGRRRCVGSSGRIRQGGVPRAALWGRGR